MEHMFVTGVHAVLALALIAGVLFSSTRIQHMAILSTLLIVLFSIRMNGGASSESIPTLSDLGIALFLREDTPSLTNATFEEILVSSLTFLHILRIAFLSVFPVKKFFEA